MKMGLIHLFCILAILIQSLPLRVCALEKLAFGSNCHEREVTAAAVRHVPDCDASHIDENTAASSSDHPSTCLCETPKSPVKVQQLNVALPPVLLASALDFISCLSIPRLRAPIEFSASFTPAPAVSIQLPLLI